MLTLKSFLKFICGLENPFICYLDLGGGGSPPPPDPNIGIAAQQNAEVGREALAFNRQVYEEGKPRQAEMDALAKKVVAQQLDVGDANQKQAADQWARFQELFVPVENQMVKDAMTIDSAAEQERAAGDAGTQVVKSYDAAQKQGARNLASMGINPNSGRALAATSTIGAMKAADEAGAMNNARQIVKDKGIALRAGAANFGRNMPNTAANSYGLTLNSGNSATSNQGAAINTALAGAGQMNQGFGTSIQGNSSAGNLLLGQYNGQLNAWGQQQQADAAGAAGMGKLVGAGIGFMAGGPAGASIGAQIGSSKKIKENKQPIEDAEILSEVKTLPVESWKYKKGVADEGEHIGAYAEDVQAKFGDKAAPGGKAIDLISMHGITLSAVKGLAKQVDKLESKVNKIASSGIRRSA